MTLKSRTTIADRRRHVQLQARTATSDSEGSPQDTWATVGFVWAQVQALSATEHIAAAQAGVVITHTVNIRYRKDVTHNSRILDGTRVLQVISQPIDPEEKHIELDLLCQELVQP